MTHIYSENVSVSHMKHTPHWGFCIYNSWQHYMLEFINHDSNTSVPFLPTASRLQQQPDAARTLEPKGTDSRSKMERTQQEHKFSSVRQSAWCKSSNNTAMLSEIGRMI